MNASSEWVVGTRSPARVRPGAEARGDVVRSGASDAAGEIAAARELDRWPDIYRRLGQLRVAPDGAVSTGGTESDCWNEDNGLICRADGIGYGDGALWAALTVQEGIERYLIAAVNLPHRSRDDSGGIDFVCRTAAERLVIDTDTKGTTELAHLEATASSHRSARCAATARCCKLRRYPRLWTLDVVVQERSRELLRQWARVVSISPLMTRPVR